MKKLIIVMAAALSVAACEPTKSQPQQRNVQADKAAAAANAIVFSDNSEIDNIKARIELTSKPGTIGFVILLNESGQPIMYEGVKGKITSGSKRLTKPTAIRHSSNMNGQGWLLDQSPSDEGTWGSSNEYIFYWNQNGEYRQWNGKYLYSDKPFRLRVEPLVVNVN